MRALHHVRVGPEALDPAAALAWVDGRGNGAGTLFRGVVRERNLGKAVVAVSYDAFVPLAEKVLARICAEAGERWGQNLRIFVAHRTGRLAVGEASVVIGAGATHRDESFQAARYVIEQLKARAPIWKKEYYEDGETDWLRGHALCGHGHAEAGGRGDRA